MNNTVVVKGSGIGIRIKVPSHVKGEVTMVKNNKLTPVTLKGNTTVRFAA